MGEVPIPYATTWRVDVGGKKFDGKNIWPTNENKIACTNQI